MAVNVDLGSINMRTVIMERLPLAFSLRLREDYPMVADNLQVNRSPLPDLLEYVDYTFHSFIANIHKQNREETTLYEYPATVWEFFKKKYAPKWFLRLYPVRYESKKISILIEKNFMCPHMSSTEQQYHVLWMMDSVDPVYLK